MELKSTQASSLGYNSADQFMRGVGERNEQKSLGSSLKIIVPAAASGTAARYRECLKNHAASAGGNVLDGCGEFMPSGDDGTLEALQCAACNCHRNFHRKSEDGGGEFNFARSAVVHPLQLPPPLPSPSLKQHPRIVVGGGGGGTHINHWASIVPPVKIAFGGCTGGSGGTESSSEDLNVYQSNAVATAAAPPPPTYVLSKKRFRTKFTQDQKGRMMEFAERVGWRIPREDDAEVQRFCGELGVKRQVLKVWMHNNKSSSSKKQQQQQEQPEGPESYNNHASNKEAQVRE